MWSEVWFLNFLRSICTHTHFYAWKFSAQKLWHREAFPRTSFYTLQSKFYTSIFDVRPYFHAKKVAFDVVKNRQFTSIFDVRPSFCAKGLRLLLEIHNFTLDFHVRPSFHAQGLHMFSSPGLSKLQLQMFQQFFDISIWHCAIAILPQFLPFDMDCIWHFKFRFGTRLGFGHAPSPQSVAPAQDKFPLRHTSFGRPARTISTDGCSGRRTNLHSTTRLGIQQARSPQRPRFDRCGLAAPAAKRDK